MLFAGRLDTEGQVLSTAVLWVMGVGANGFREYLGVWIGNAASGLVWSRVFKDLHQRGQVHYLRNVLSKVSTPTRQEAVLAALRDVWSAPTRAAAEARGQVLVDSLRASLSAVADWLEETLGDTLGSYLLKESEARWHLRTTNALEREHEEIRRRTRVIRIFPNEASYLRLASALAADRNDGWAKRRYISVLDLANLDSRDSRYALIHLKHYRCETTLAPAIPPRALRHVGMVSDLSGSG
jgi:transposase-like protein